MMAAMHHFAVVDKSLSLQEETYRETGRNRAERKKAQKEAYETNE